MKEGPTPLPADEATMARLGMFLSEPIATSPTIGLMSSDFPRRYKARYAFSMAAEINKNVVLDNGEVICCSQQVSERQNWLFARPCLLAITQLRPILLEHCLLSADWILEIPRSAVGRITHEKSWCRGWVILADSDSGETRTVQFRPMQRRGPYEAADQKLFDVLSAFHLGNLHPLD
jgi:hypothetical protein